MASPSYLLLLPILSHLPSIAAHGHVTGIVANNIWYTGWNAEMKYLTPIPATAGWPCDNLDNGFIAPSAFATADIICHKSATNGQASVPITAGSTLSFEWNTWPVSHKGPVINYIADCGGDCTTVDKTTLKFVKLDAAGWIEGNNPGTWATDTLIANNITASTTIPKDLKSGGYVVRHEIIALHAAGQANGAQAYPQCVNIEVTGGGSAGVSGGVSAEGFYTCTDPGILFDIYTAFTGYVIPGPAVVVLRRRAEGVRRHVREWVGGW
ncbi:glycoside hydrolase [Lophium mytilinum]|uniref:Glycoside hydrolase n=1 Tax=Lophium mytilinum TaxID=390894 RepID=A0A6A6QMV7_9PEZI|nr:glycoside hydrolase [Lophium mytilinum]